MLRSLFRLIISNSILLSRQNVWCRFNNKKLGQHYLIVNLKKTHPVINHKGRLRKTHIKCSTLLHNSFRIQVNGLSIEGRSYTYRYVSTMRLVTTAKFQFRCLIHTAHIPPARVLPTQYCTTTNTTFPCRLLFIMQ